MAMPRTLQAAAMTEGRDLCMDHSTAAIRTCRLQWWGNKNEQEREQVRQRGARRCRASRAGECALEWLTSVWLDTPEVVLG